MKQHCPKYLLPGRHTLPLCILSVRMANFSQREQQIGPKHVTVLREIILSVQASQTTDPNIPVTSLCQCHRKDFKRNVIILNINY